MRKMLTKSLKSDRLECSRVWKISDVENPKNKEEIRK